MDYRKVVEYIVESYRKGRLVTVLDASHKFDCSVSSIRKYIAKLKKSDDEKDIILYNSYLEVSNINKLNGHILGGKNGKRSSKLSDKVVYDLCEYIVDNDYTLRQMEKITSIPKSTLYERLDKLKDPRLQSVYDDHRRNALNNYNNDVENSNEFNFVGKELSRRVTSSKR
jgi:hypothetical protein